MEHIDDKLIDRFLRGELTEDEKKNFELRMEAEEEFGQRVKEMEQVQAGLRESVLEEKRTFLKELEAEVMLEDEKPQTEKKTREGKENSNEGLKLRRLWWLVAASFLVGAVMLWPDEKLEGPSEEYAYLFEEGEFEKTFEHETLRSGESNLSAQQVLAYRLYVNQDFEFAIPKLKKLWEEQGDSIAHKYLLYCYLATNKIDKIPSSIND